MRLNQWMTYIAAGSMFASANVLAANAIHEQVQVPQCLAAKIATPHVVLAENKDFKIIDISESDLDALSHLADQVNCGRFVNVSHKIEGSQIAVKKQTAQSLLQQKTVKAKPLSDNIYEIKHQEEVNEELKNIVSDNIWHTLSQLTAIHNRSATKETGVFTAYWLEGQFNKMVIESGRTDTETFFVETGRYKQPSLVTVIGKDIKAPAIVIGAHMDTLDGRMPGAGDDGSGSSSNMEMARVLLNSKIAFKRPIYIIWYAAEERGLVGSQHVVKHFRSKSIPVKAAIQFDMTGYRVHANDPTMWVFTDYTDEKLSNFVAQLIKTYVHVPVRYSECGYGCSDHASWDDVGVPAAFPCESNFEDHNPYIHSSDDTMEKLSLEHMTNFSKLALAFAIEMALE
ncbi:aminopeptidase LapA [Legionella longbeachae]|uniref:Putative aminopeptidase n=1 Tax=Legionella longbeachae serogroup 1 (strain NSW150) TaxID=661367 RepID=D3HNX0_LEGLN|nr:M28 family peptidase [Legionella longbeachae]VEE01110.1 aminopeptidase [Legionella oakridgensis]HBD7398449.1 M28 family peptidase [Legionella pneumophila]ARB92512.1 aminopeptidase [Legionella longbeachae]ARM34308.1 M28 family peptidase [Legionella longbeachae]EEZ96417.1 leucine aminopeptidase LapA [Legionella longbeachae D-4968]